MIGIACTSASASPVATGWSDSYAVEGQCYCDSSFDHGLNETRVNTPQGSKSVRQVCTDIRNKFGYGPSSGRTYYNTVQCGHGPANNARDEAICPGIPRGTSNALGNFNGAQCQETGATWNLDKLYNSALSQPELDTPPDLAPQQDPEAEPTPELELQPDSEPPPDLARPPEPELSPQLEFQPDIEAQPQLELPPDQDLQPEPAFQPEPELQPDLEAQPEFDAPTEQDLQTQPQATEQTTTTSPIEQTFPPCSSVGSDDNNDGYGWENNQTCLVVNTNGNDQPTSNTPPIAQLFPACSSTEADDNNDGYGWENDQTCLVITNTVIEQTTNTTSPDLFFPECSDVVK